MVNRLSSVQGGVPLPARILNQASDPVPITGGAGGLGISFADSSSIDAFGRSRVSSPFTIFDNKQIVDNQPLFWDDAEESGSGTSSTYNTNQASTTISVGASIAGVRLRRTFRRFNYQPGKSQQVLMTTSFQEGKVGVTKQVGIFDDNNGLYFKLNGTTLSIVQRSNVSSSPVDTTIAQDSWNLDKFDGTGASGVVIDITKTQILVIDFEWLGVGRIRFGFNIDGQTIYCHELLNANTLTTVYISTPNLPLGYRIENDGTGEASSLTHICSTIVSEGGLDLVGTERSVDRGSTALTTLNDTSIYPLVAIRLKSTHLGITTQLTAISVICSSTADYRWAILFNPTVTGTALSYSALTNSAIETAVGATNATTVSGGILVKSGYQRQTNQSGGEITTPIRSLLALGEAIDGTRDFFVLAVQRITGTTESFFGSLGWLELS